MSVTISGTTGMSANGVQFLVGQVCHFAMATAPSGFIIADGTAISRTTYGDLFASISTSFGVGDGSTTFNIPNLLGEFIRGVDNAEGNDIGAAINDTGNVTNASAVITTLTSTTDMEVDMLVTGNGIPAATKILTIDSATQVTLDTNATATGTGVALIFSNRTDRGDGNIGDVVGSKQSNQVQSHLHDMTSTGVPQGSSGTGADRNSGTGRSAPTNAHGGNETRPRNVAMLPCIFTGVA